MGQNNLRAFITLLSVVLLSSIFMPPEAWSLQGGLENIPTKNFFFNFEDAAVGALPAGWKAEETNPKKGSSKWEIAEDITAPSGKNVLALVYSANSGETFNICWTDKLAFRDGEVSVRLKAVRGTEDQGGGVIWRVKDKNNYYVARVNPLEKNLRLYYVKAGKRKLLAGRKTDIPAREWHTMKVTQKGRHIEVFLDNKKMLDADDPAFTGAGGVGLWTKADAVTSFDNLSVLTGD